MLKKMMMLVVAMQVAFVIGCRPPESNQQTGNNQQTVEGSGIDYFDGLRLALENEDLLLRQLGKHRDQFDMQWPFQEALIMTNMRIQRIQSVLRDNDIPTAITVRSLNEAATLEEALKQDADLQMEIVKMYQDVRFAKSRNANAEFVTSLMNSAAKTQNILEKHDGVPVEKLKEYQEKKLRKRPN